MATTFLNPSARKPRLFDFVGTSTRHFKGMVFGKNVEKVRALPYARAPIKMDGHGNIVNRYIDVTTPDGTLRIYVSEQVHDLIEIGGPLVVAYRRGRWSGALKGEIAR